MDDLEQQLVELGVVQLGEQLYDLVGALIAAVRRADLVAAEVLLDERRVR